MKKHLYLLLTLFAISSCAPRGDGSYSRGSLGTLTGAVIGGVIGNQFGGGSGRDWATVGGALYGAAVGSDWGYAVDRYQLQNKTRSSNGVFEYLPDETYKAWINPNTGRSESVRPIKSFHLGDQDDSGYSDCRLFETTRNGHLHALGMVCRDELGRWRLIE